MSSALPDLFPGFETRRITTAGAEIYCRIGGSGPPLVLLHGYPQTHVCWHRIAPELARHATVVLLDLRGYGTSSCPPRTLETDPDHEVYSKRAMARDVREVMAKLGHERFMVAGHDRGARVGYRLALDYPEAVSRLIPIDILPTFDVWAGLRWRSAIASYHWTFLAQPAPLPETLIAADPAYYVSHTLASWTANKTLEAFAPEALQHYRDALMLPERIHAVCEDYRAGASYDQRADEMDLAKGRKIECPVLVLWGTDYIGKAAADPLDVWRRWSPDVTGTAVKSGHFIAEENPSGMLAALLPFIADAGHG
jgi:haloacetate dehalogenase